MITGGNEFKFRPQVRVLDGSFADVLLNDKKGGFILLSRNKPGWNFTGS
jgi:hypothetical protein